VELAMKHFLIFFALMLLAGSAIAGDQTTAQTAKAICIDVRTAEEYATGFYPGAINISYEVIGEKISAVAPDKSAEIHLYCRSGRRSGIALKTLMDMGYTHVINEGGYAEIMTRKSQ
jgi:phage shock protein E